MRRSLLSSSSAFLRTLALPFVSLLLLLLVVVVPAAVATETTASTPYLMPTHTMHDYTHVYTGAEHPSNMPSVKIDQRSTTEIEREREADDLVYAQLEKEHRVDQDGNMVAPPSAASASAANDSPPASSPATGGSSASPGYSPEVASFLEKASTTLNSVLQHDAKAVFHFKRMVARAKASLTAKRYDQAATLFKEASNFYFGELRAPYAKIASSTALGDTIEKRIASQLEQERGDGTGEARGPNTAAQQFRTKELENQPHVHTALVEYHKALKHAANGKVEKKAAQVTAAKATATAAKAAARR